MANDFTPAQCVFHIDGVPIHAEAEGAHIERMFADDKLQGPGSEFEDPGNEVCKGPIDVANQASCVKYRKGHHRVFRFESTNKTQCGMSSKRRDSKSADARSKLTYVYHVLWLDPRLIGSWYTYVDFGLAFADLESLLLEDIPHCVLVG